MPYTTGCKFNIASLKSGAKEPLVRNRVLQPKCAAAIREMHFRNDADLDKLLSYEDTCTLFKEIRQQELVCSVAV